MTSLAVLVFKGQGPAYRALNSVEDHVGLETLEIIPLGDESQLLVKGPADSLQKWVSSVSQVVSKTIVESWDVKIERAFYSLELKAPERGLMLVEGVSLGALFKAAAQALQEGLQIVDLKIPRGSVKWGVLTLTSPSLSQAMADKIAQASGLTTTWIPETSKGLRRYFDIEA